MPSSPATTAVPEPPEVALLRRKVDSLTELNARIARLAMGLGVSMGQEADVQRVLGYQKPAVELERSVTADRRSSSRGGGGSPDRRASHCWEELRGLVVLRYEMETRYAQEMGLTATRELFSVVSESMEREGFAPDQDDVAMKKLLDRS